jgi:hypothetical protein
MGGVATNAAGGQARMYARKEDKVTKAILWESQVGSTTGSSVDEDTMYPGSFVLDAANDALYFSGALGYLTSAPRGAIFRIKASSADGNFSWSYATLSGMDYAFAPMTVDETGGLYGYNRELDSIVRMDPTAPDHRLWGASQAEHPNTIYAEGGVVYAPYPSGKIIRVNRVTGSVIK